MVNDSPSVQLLIAVYFVHAISDSEICCNICIKLQSIGNGKIISNSQITINMAKMLTCVFSLVGGQIGNAMFIGRKSQ
jgi:hypothetical protein